MKVIFGEIYVPDAAKFRADYATFISSKYAVSLDVVAFAAEKALKAWKKGERISRSLSLEVLLYYAATRQIRDAVRLGVRDGLNRVAAVVIDEEKFATSNFKELEFVPEYDVRAVMDHYGITDAEVAAVGTEKIPLLVRERIALFAALKE